MKGFKKIMKKGGFFVTFLLLLGYYISLSGQFDPWHLGLGVVSCLVVASMSWDLFFYKRPDRQKLREIYRFMAYVPWLLYGVFLANIHVLRLALHPKMKKLIYPHVVRFKTKLRGDLPMVTLANSITLTPGTITIKIEGDTFYVHAIDLKVAEDLPEGMEGRVEEIFGG